MGTARKLRIPNFAFERSSATSAFRKQWRRSPSHAPLTLISSADESHEMQDAVKEEMRALATRLTMSHPAISTDPGIYGGNPHIKNVRLTVGNILAKIYVYGDIKAVADIYAPHVNEGQIKEAIAYAQDFLEAAIHPHKAPQGDGG